MAAYAQGTFGHAAHHVTSRITPSAASLQARLHNFVKYALLQQLVPPGSSVCDLYCGRGGDIEKWARTQIGRYVGLDFASSTLEEAREAWDNYNRPYSADFCELDPSVANLENELRYMGLPVDFVTCMGHLQDSFMKEEMVRRLLQNVASILKPGGCFFGITADSSTIWSKYQKAVEGAHRAGMVRALPRVHSEHYIISFEDDRFTPFGTKYTLQFADGVICESQQLIHFPSLIRLAEEVGLEYIELQNLQEFYDDYRIQFLDILRATCANLVDPKGKLPQFAHDILSLYTTFIFKKAEHLDPDYMLSPVPTLLDEDQLEMYSEDIYDGNTAPHQKYMYPPGNEQSLTLTRLSVEIAHQNEAKEAYYNVKREEDHKGYPAVSQMESNRQDLQLGDAREENSQDVHLGRNSKESDSKEEVLLGATTIKVIVDEDQEDIEMEDEFVMEPSINGESVPSLNGFECQLGSREMEYVPLQQGTCMSVDSKIPVSDVKQTTNVVDEIDVSPPCLQNGNESMGGETPILSDSITGEMIKEQKERSCLEKQALEENVAKQCDLVATSLGECTTGQSIPKPLKEDLASPPVNDTSMARLESEEQRTDDPPPVDFKNEKPRDDGEICTINVRKEVPSISSIDADDERLSSKQSLGRINTSSKDEVSSKRSILQSGLTSGQPRYRAPKPHHHHPLRTEERQEHLHRPRHHISSSHSSKASRERIGDQRVDHSSPKHKNDGHRGRSRNSHSSPTFIPFSQFVPLTEFPVFQSPNTPGILGPGPPVRLLEPIVPLWAIPTALDRRPFPKARTPRKLGSDRESSGSRARKESPKRQWKDSPPPGTES